MEGTKSFRADLGIENLTILLQIKINGDQVLKNRLGFREDFILAAAYSLREIQSGFMKTSVQE